MIFHLQYMIIIYFTVFLSYTDVSVVQKLLAAILLRASPSTDRNKRKI